MFIVLANLCVGIDTMEGLSGRVDCSFEDEGGMLFRFEDELDIIGEEEIDPNLSD